MRLSFYSGLILAAICADNLAQAVKLGLATDLEIEKTGLNKLVNDSKMKSNVVEAKIDNDPSVQKMQAIVAGLKPKYNSKGKGGKSMSTANSKLVADVSSTKEL